MLQQDLEAAGVAYIDNLGRVLDFHGLRHSFVTNLSHAPSRVAQSLAQHKTSAMTDRYTHVRPNDERAALAILPDLTARPSDEQARATGTDDAVAGDQQGYLIPRIHARKVGRFAVHTEESPRKSAQTKTAFARAKTRFSREAEGSRTLNLRIDSPML